MVIRTKRIGSLVTTTQPILRMQALCLSWGRVERALSSMIQYFCTLNAMIDVVWVGLIEVYTRNALHQEEGFPPSIPLSNCVKHT